MDELPSIWGRHQQAQIDPMMVRGKLLTSVMDAPDDWNTRLSALGFRKTNSGWIKLGSLKPSEFAYLSSDIDLIGLRADDIREATESEPDKVPLDVQDTLLRLWQRQTATVMVALSMEHEATHTRAQAWSFVEAALAGELTPETETLFGLTLTKLSKSDPGLSAGATSFAEELGWKVPAKPSMLGQNTKLLFNKGETVEWLDADGALQSGRLARRVSVTDRGCWVIQSPRWAGGYAFAAPAWVERTQLYFAHSAQDWKNDEAVAGLIKQANKVSSDVYLEPQAVSEVLVDYTPEQLQLLQGYLRGHNDAFPPVAGVEPLFEKMREHESWREDREQFYSQQNLNWLKSLAASMAATSKLLYGKSPIELVMTMEPIEIGEQLVRQPAMTLAVTLGSGRDVSKSGVICAQVLKDNQLDLGGAAKVVEEQRYAIEKSIKASSAELASIAGMPVKHAMQASEFHSASPMFWPKVAEFYEGQVTLDDVVRVKSVLLRGSANMVMRPNGKNLLEAFSAYLYSAPKEGANLEELVVSVKDASCSLVDVDAVVAELASNKVLNADWINSVAVSHAELYEATVTHPKRADFLFPTGVNARPTGSFDAKRNATRALFRTPGEAIERYAALLTAIEPLADENTKVTITQLHKLANRYEVYQRLMEIPSKLASMPREELRQRVKAQVYMAQAKKVGQMSEDGQTRFFNQIAEAMLESNSQGAVCLFSSSGRGFTWRVKGVPMGADTLDQTRAATLEGAMLKLKNSVRSRGVGLLVDGVAIADPELAEMLNGDGPAQLKEVVKADQDGYQDTGVVAGLAMKDIRGMRTMELLDAADQMSDQQKAKYLTRELIWPRRSFEEMKESGVDLHTAYAYDVLWKAMPKAPLTSARNHVNGFISVITGMKEAVEPLLKFPFMALGDADFVTKAKAATLELWCEKLDDTVRRMYRHELRIRGYGGRLSWNSYDPSGSRKFMTDVKELSWSDVLKSKKLKTTTAVGGSRVARGDLVRKGPDYREGKSVTGEDFIRTFGFSGVEYGNWTNQAEREKHLNLAYDSMMDFVRVMGWEPMTLSLGGKLGLCIGSRGRGGSRAANAHFEPVNMAINLTRMRGDGALAHEYFHAVANHYGRLATGTAVDMANTFGYVLQKDGAVPGIDRTGLREEVQRAFQNLIVSIMRKPEGADEFMDISKYTQRSDMLLTSMAKDGASGDYWGSPCEMFARSMEVWFKDRLRDAGEQNDYLVRADKDAEENSVYPDMQHLSRINYFVSPWLEAIKQDVAQVEHPFLGAVEMPILNTELRSVMPLTPALLVELANVELDRLFRACAPNLLIVDDPVYRAGMYDLGRDLMVLNAQYADKGTFYHEAWHACHGKLLTSDERYGLSQVFSVNGILADQVERLMREQGVDDAVIEHMRSDTQEVQAYAFQLWQEGRFDFDEHTVQESNSFYRVGTFVEGVTGVGAYFGQQEAERLFTRFMAGELAVRSTFSAGESASIHGDPDWDSDSTLYWDTAGALDQVNDDVAEVKNAAVGMR